LCYNDVGFLFYLYAQYYSRDVDLDRRTTYNVYNLKTHYDLDLYTECPVLLTFPRQITRKLNLTKIF